LNFSKSAQKPSLIESRDIFDKNINRFRDTLQGNHWASVTDKTDAQLAYTTFSDNFL
jgi:hypothetical protein